MQNRLEHIRDSHANDTYQADVYATISTEDTEDTSMTYYGLTENEFKPFKCNKCDSAFSGKQNLNMHIVSVHDGKKPFKCNVCNKTFPQKQSQTIRTMLDDLSINEDSSNEDTLPLTNEEVTGAVFEKSLIWMEHNSNWHIQAVHEGKKPFHKKQSTWFKRLCNHYGWGRVFFCLLLYGEQESNLAL